MNATRSVLGARLGAEFFDRPTLAVAREMLGATLCRRVGRGTMVGRIVEVEAYVGEEDRACHASARSKGRARGLYVPAGHYYVYRIYGMYWCLNVVTEREGFPAAVLVRALEPERGIHLMERRRPGVSRARDLARGPGRLTRALDVDGRFHGRSVETGALWLEGGPAVPESRVVACPRIGVEYAGEWKDRPWRFYDRASDSVSRRDRTAERAGEAP